MVVTSECDAMNADQSRHGIPWIIPAAALTCFGTYMAVYYALVCPTFYCGGWHDLQKPAARYTHGGQFAETLFVPANWLDRVIRPHTWEEQEM